MRTSFLSIALALLTTWQAVAAPAKKEFETRVDAFVAPLIEQGVFSGVVLVAKGDDVLLNRSYGNANYEFNVPNTPDTRFSIASITKPLTGVILRKLEHEKKLSLSDPLSKYVPSFPSADKITLEHLRTHRSGLRDPEKMRRVIRLNLSTDEVVEAISTEPLGSAPGEQYSYTTANYAVLAKVIEKVTGSTFATVIRKMIYDPAGMKDSGELTRTTVVPRLATGYMPDPYGTGLSVSGPEDTSWKVGGGSSYSTTADLHRFARAFYGGKLTPGQNPREILGTGKLLDKDVLRSSGGFPGASANIAYFIDDEVTVVALSNNYAPVTSWIVDAASAMYFERPYEIPQAVRRFASPRPAQELIGRYKMGTFPPFSVTLRDGQPFLAWTPVRVSELVPVAPDVWFEKLDWMTLKAERDENGRITGFTATAPWTSTPMKVTPVP